jgi:parallel beta-helix repeat protein
MQIARLTIVALVAAAVAGGCGGEFEASSCADMKSTHCMEITGSDSAALQSAVNSIDDGTTIVLGKGTFKMTNQLTIRTKGMHLIGQGMDKTVLDFGSTTTQGNGVDVIGDDFLIQDLTVLDAPKDGIRVEASNGVVYRRIRATWSTPSSSDNGAYGIYPVKSQNVLVEHSRAENASDAGLYVGQCQHVIVRNNVVTGNVAGLEIENTQYADVHDNLAENNTGGIVVFDLPGNPIIGRDVRMHDNIIRNNNHVNFAAGGTVANILVGTGTFAMASRRVEITNNTYSHNNSTDISVISGLAIEPDPEKWMLDATKLTGKFDDLGLMVAAPGVVMNFRSENVMVAGNKHSGSGTAPDVADPLMLGILLALANPGRPIDSLLYDAIGESEFNSTDATKNSNDNHMCFGGNTGGTFASMALDKQSATSMLAFFRPAAPFAPFQCTELKGGAVAEVVLP